MSIHEKLKNISRDHVVEYKQLTEIPKKDALSIKSQEEKLSGCLKLCRVIDVYDGDTCTVILHNGNELEKFKLRIYGYDSPEKKVSTKLCAEDRKVAKDKALEATNAFCAFIDKKITAVNIMKKDKYGRLLGELYAFTDESEFKESHTYNVKDFMLLNGYGYAYTGGRKQPIKVSP